MDVITIERDGLRYEVEHPLSPDLTLWVDGDSRSYRVRIRIAPGLGDRVRRVRSRRKSLTESRRKE